MRRRQVLHLQEQDKTESKEPAQVFTSINTHKPGECQKCGKIIKRGMFLHNKYCKG